MVYRISKFVVLILFILKFLILYINAIPPPSSPLPPAASHSLSPASTSLNSCNCVPATDCAAYTALVRQLKGVIERMRNTACGLAYDSEPMVCCPAIARSSKPERSSDTQAFNNMHNDFSTHTQERWVWDRRAVTANNDDDRKTDMINIQSKFLDDPTAYDFTSTNLLNDYYDWKTRKNCPPILFREKPEFSRYYNRPQYHELHHDFHHHYPHPHPHYTPHDHHFEFNHNHNYHGRHHGHLDFDDDYANSHHDDGGVIYPDNRHTFWPPAVWPDPETSASNNRDQQTSTPTTVISTTTKSFRITSTTTTPKPTINSPNCGVTLNKRIIGGIEALPGEFPWITRIAYLNNTDGSIAYRCSGSFITDLHIITAAHCVTNLDAALSLSHVRIVDLDGNNNQQQSQSIYEIEETFVHPNFDRPKRANDVAIIKIIRPEGVTVNYGTICLPTLTDFANSGTGVVAGWSNNEGNFENDLRVRYLRLPILNNTECASRYEMFRQGFVEKITIDRGMLCTQGLSNGSDVCRGDSGGPLMNDGSTVLNSDGRYTLMGIVAFGPICGFTNLLPGVYMRISEFVGWISNTIR